MEQVFLFLQDIHISIKTRYLERGGHDDPHSRR